MDCAVYVDTDNQSPREAPALLDALGSRGLSIRSMAIFGNERSGSLGHWRGALGRCEALRGRLQVHQVPCEDQAADVAILLAVGRKLRHHVAAGVRVVIVSRDKLLIACARRIAGMGAQVLVCHDDSAAAKCGVETVVLSEPACSPQQPAGHRPAIRRGALPQKPAAVAKRRA